MDNDEAAEAVEGHSRRAFLASAAGLTGVALAAGAWRAPAAFGADAAPVAPAVGSGAAAPGAGGVPGPVLIALTLDGTAAGALRSFEGGHPEADVVTEKLGADHIIHKHIGGVKYEDISVSCGTGMVKGFYNWVKDSFDSKFSRHDGSVDVGSIIGGTSTLAFSSALISEIGMPALDAASKDAAKMTIKLSPEITRFSRSGGKLPINTKIQKQWTPANFRLEIDGLDATRVNKIDAITIKQTNVLVSPGGGTAVVLGPAKLEFPDLQIQLPEANADSWFQWLEEFVVKGNNGQDAERGGKLAYLATDGTALFTLGFRNLGIFKLTPDKVEAGSDNLRRSVSASLYCEQITFDHFLQ